MADTIKKLRASERNLIKRCEVLLRLHQNAKKKQEQEEEDYLVEINRQKKKRLPSIHNII